MSDFETRLTRASAPAESHASQSESKADTACDSLLGTVKSTFDPFKETFSSEGGTLHHVSEAVNSLASLQGMPSQLLNTGIAQIPLLDKMPGMPAATIGVPHLGTPHAHSHPPSSGFPLPSVGATIGSGCLSVLIGGIPAARVLDIGIAPTCGGITPFFDIQTGSSNTFIGGMRAARMGIDMTRHCNPMGHVGHSGGEAASAAEKGEEVASEAAQVSGRAKLLGRAGKAWSVGNAAVGPASGAATAADDASQGEIAAAAMMAAQTAADLAFMALSNLMGKDPGIEPSMGALLAGDPTVLIGGFPLPDSQMMWHAAKHGIGKNVEPKLQKLPQELKCEFRGEPINPVTGDVRNDFIDYKTDEVAPFIWGRHYNSSRRDRDGPLGYGFRHAWQHELRLLRTRAIYTDPQGTEYTFSRHADGSYDGYAQGYELKQFDNRRVIVSHDVEGSASFDLTGEADRTARCISYMRDGVHSKLHWRADKYLWKIVQSDRSGHVCRTAGFQYDHHGRMVTVVLTDRNGVNARICGYAYDAYGCLISYHNALNAVSTYEYDIQRRAVVLTDANGYSFFYRYDSQGRCLEGFGQDGMWHVQFQYHPGRTIVIEGDGGRWTIVYNDVGTIIRVVDPYGGATAYMLDADGRIMGEIDSGDRPLYWLYDERGRNTGRLDRWGNRWPIKDEAPILPNPLIRSIPETHLEQQHGNVDLENMVEMLLLPPDVTHISGQMFSCDMSQSLTQCDAAGRVVVRSTDSGQLEYIEHDADGNVVRERDADGRDYRYGIYSWGLRKSELDPLGNTVSYTHNPKLEISSIIDANGNRSTYTYDLKNRITSVTRHGLIRETYTYDVGDRLIEKRNGGGEILLRFEVGENGLYSRCHLADGDTHIYEHDLRGNFTSASTNRFDVKLLWDEGGRRISDKRNGLGVEHVHVDGRLISTTYLGRYVVRYKDDADRAILIHTPDGSVHRFQRAKNRTVLFELGNGTRILYGYDAEERCIGRITWRQEKTNPIFSTRYKYSGTGELRWICDTVKGETQYRYDNAHRLIAESLNGWPVRHFSYDAAGNPLCTERHKWIRYDEGNQLAISAAGTYRYNERNHLAEETCEDRSVKYHYNSMDLLVSVTWSDRTEVWSAAYDGLCRRVVKEFGKNRTEYYWDGDRLAAEIAANGQFRIYVYVNETAMLPFMFVDYPGAGAPPEIGQPYFVFSNQVGLPEWIENDNRKTVWSAKSIDPYGTIHVADGNSIEYDLRWPGHWMDQETGLHYNRFRSYSPALGQYLQSDPMGQAGAINVYAYPKNPLTLVDIMGLHARYSGPGQGNGKKKNKHDPTGPKQEAAVGKNSPEPQEPEYTEGCVDWEHIFSGEYDNNGKLHGGHHVQSFTDKHSRAKVKPAKDEIPVPGQPYKAEITYPGRETAIKDMFPESWGEPEIKSQVLSALNGPDMEIEKNTSSNQNDGRDVRKFTAKAPPPSKLTIVGYIDVNKPKGDKKRIGTAHPVSPPGMPARGAKSGKATKRR
ncbi:hypothetical protein CFB40_25210 [Burkholderia sp. AU31652]|uniref:RHS repeat-associated core domain-containing protein n=1 Tax=Burkholderia sp. AU31652 TaxID=2015354 RepID=UPI000B7A840C|nr:RHS repeat-associated core domain-containing protein [Burkholderia sp. AU31652]OXI84332.1 hypothetical protein CFB40_25210 [Burkholderia sp. AU31652]